MFSLVNTQGLLRPSRPWVLVRSGARIWDLPHGSPVHFQLELAAHRLSILWTTGLICLPLHSTISQLNSIQLHHHNSTQLTLLCLTNSANIPDFQQANDLKTFVQLASSKNEPPSGNFSIHYLFQSVKMEVFVADCSKCWVETICPMKVVWKIRNWLVLNLICVPFYQIVGSRLNPERTETISFK